jgi:hypothetical protein
MNKQLQLTLENFSGDELKTELHKLAHDLLLKKDVQGAWKVLLSA